jgi:hypothetical protein
MRGIIYKVTSPSGRIYIGKTEMSLDARKYHHFVVAKNGSSLLFSRAIRKYGSSLSWEIIDTAENSDDLSKLEINWIKYYKAFGSGYNLTLGGEGYRIHKTKEDYEKAKIRYKIRQKEKQDIYRKTPEYKEKRKVFDKKYNKSLKRKVWFKEYRNIPEHKEKHKILRKKYYERMKK